MSVASQPQFLSQHSPVQLQPLPQKSIDEEFTEKAVSSLGQVETNEQAASLIRAMLFSYRGKRLLSFIPLTERIKQDLQAGEKKLIMTLLRENDILKKGVRIQNRRFEVSFNSLIFW